MKKQPTLKSTSPRDVRNIPVNSAPALPPEERIAEAVTRALLRLLPLRQIDPPPNGAGACLSALPGLKDPVGPQRPRAVEDSLGSLQGVIDDTHRLISMLEEAISPILTPVQPENIAGEGLVANPVSRPPAPMLCSLDGFASQLATATRRLEHLLSRVQFAR